MCTIMMMRCSSSALALSLCALNLFISASFGIGTSLCLTQSPSTSGFSGISSSYLHSTLSRRSAGSTVLGLFRGDDMWYLSTAIGGSHVGSGTGPLLMICGRGASPEV